MRTGPGTGVGGGGTTKPKPRRKVRRKPNAGDAAVDAVADVGRKVVKDAVKAPAKHKAKGKSGGASAGDLLDIAAGGKDRRRAQRKRHAAHRMTPQEQRAMDDVLDQLADERKRTPGRLLENAGRDVRDIVTGAPASVAAIAKGLAEESENVQKNVITLATGGKAREDKHFRSRKAGLKPISDSIAQESPVYALGEAAVKKAKGDDRGASRAFEKAKKKAFERPVTALGEASIVGTLASRAATAGKYAGKGGTEAARARPARQVKRDDGSSREQVARERAAAQAQVRERQRRSGEPRKARKVTREADDAARAAGTRPQQPLQREQPYPAGAVARSVVKLREDRRAAKGKDPFVATRRQTRRLTKRRHDEIRRNAKAGGLAREKIALGAVQAAEKGLTADERIMAQLMANERVRPASAREDVRKLRHQAAKGDLPNDVANVAVLERLERDAARTAARPGVQAAARTQRDRLVESEGRLAREGYFDGKGARGPRDPKFVAAMQPHMARGEIRRVEGPPPKTDGDTPPAAPPPSLSPPTPRLAGKEGGTPTTPPKRKAGKRADVEQQLRRQQWKKDQTRVKAIDARLAELVSHRGERFEHRAVDPENVQQSAARAIERGGETGGRSGKVSGQASQHAGQKTRVKVQGGAPRHRRVVKRALKPIPGSEKEVRALREERAQLTARMTATENAGRHAARRSEQGVRGDQQRRDDQDGDPGAQRPRAGVQPDLPLERGVASGVGGDAGLVRVDVGDAPLDGKVVVGPGGRRVVAQRDRGRVVEVGQVVEAVGRGHGPEASGTAGAARKRTPVRAPDGRRYVWHGGDRHGQEVRPEHFEGGNEAFIRGLDREGGPDDVHVAESRSGAGYAPQDAISGLLEGDRVKATLGGRERTITNTRMHRQMRETFAHRAPSGRSTFGLEEAQKIAGQLSTKGDPWDVLPAERGTYVVVRKVLADRMRAADKVRGAEKVGEILTRQFVRTVLPWSVSWHIGNVTDLMTRLVASDATLISHARRGEMRGVVAHLEQALDKLDPHLRHEILSTLKGHYGSRRETIEAPRFADATAQSRSELVRAAGEAITASRQLPGIRQAGDTVVRVTDAALNAGTRVENRLVGAAAGRAALDQARDLGIAIEDHARMAQHLAKRWQQDPAKLHDFQARALEITGDYVTRGPALRKATNMGVPFAQWIKAANTFVFKTLPQKHPVKVGLMLWANEVTAQERAELGLNLYYSHKMADKLGLPEPLGGFNSSAIVLDNGETIPTVPYTSFGEATANVEDIAQAVSGKPKQAAISAATRVAPMVGRPARAAVNQGPEVAASRIAEAFTPGAGNVRGALEGDRPHPRSTLWEPLGTGGKEPTDRVLAALRAPQAKAPYRQPKQGPGRPTPRWKQQGRLKTVTYRDANGVVRTMRYRDGE